MQTIQKAKAIYSLLFIPFFLISTALASPNTKPKINFADSVKNWFKVFTQKIQKNPPPTGTQIQEGPRLQLPLEPQIANIQKPIYLENLNSELNPKLYPESNPESKTDSNLQSSLPLPPHSSSDLEQIEILDSIPTRTAIDRKVRFIEPLLSEGTQPTLLRRFKSVKNKKSPTPLTKEDSNNSNNSLNSYFEKQVNQFKNTTELSLSRIRSQTFGLELIEKLPTLSQEYQRCFSDYFLMVKKLEIAKKQTKNKEQQKFLLSQFDVLSTHFMRYFNHQSKSDLQLLISNFRPVKNYHLDIISYELNFPLLLSNQIKHRRGDYFRFHPQQPMALWLLSKKEGQKVQFQTPPRQIQTLTPTTPSTGSTLVNSTFFSRNSSDSFQKSLDKLFQPTPSVDSFELEQIAYGLNQAIIHPFNVLQNPKSIQNPLSDLLLTLEEAIENLDAKLLSAEIETSNNVVFHNFLLIHHEFDSLERADFSNYYNFFTEFEKSLACNLYAYMKFIGDIPQETQQKLSHLQFNPTTELMEAWIQMIQLQNPENEQYIFNYFNEKLMLLKRQSLLSYKPIENQYFQIKKYSYFIQEMQQLGFFKEKTVINLNKL